MRYVLSADADLDLEAIWNYIAQDSIPAADHWLERLYEAFEAISKNPGIGHKHPALRPSLLAWPVRSYLILYRIGQAAVEIIAVTEGSRDIPSFISSRTPQ